MSRDKRQKITARGQSARARNKYRGIYCVERRKSYRWNSACALAFYGLAITTMDARKKVVNYCVYVDGSRSFDLFVVRALGAGDRYLVLCVECGLCQNSRVCGKYLEMKL